MMRSVWELLTSMVQEAAFSANATDVLLNASPLSSSASSRALLLTTRDYLSMSLDVTGLCHLHLSVIKLQKSESQKLWVLCAPSFESS